VKFSSLDVVLVTVFLAAAITGGALKVFSHELVAAIITAAVAFLTLRGKALFDKDKNKLPEAGAPDQPLEKGHSHRIIVDADGGVKVEDIAAEGQDPPPPDADGTKE
jgi:hypothetical protein